MTSWPTFFRGSDKGEVQMFEQSPTWRNYVSHSVRYSTQSVGTSSFATAFGIYSASHVIVGRLLILEWNLLQRILHPNHIYDQGRIKMGQLGYIFLLCW